MRTSSSLYYVVLIFFLCLTYTACKKTDTVVEDYAAIAAEFNTRIDPNNLANYANQGKP
ncbi:MAG: hypothetical protein RL348_28, partial [Bacteroidota bacterium]